MHDQKKLWNNAHSKDSIHHYSSQQTSFFVEVESVLSSNSRILELGCGVGNDSIAFSNAGHEIIATDLSEVAIEKNRDRFKDSPHIKFKILDMNDPFPFEHGEFDVVYARLSLHYFTDVTTRKIFSEIYRVLKPGGYLCFICKSTSDPLYGKGTEIERDMYNHEGHIRHFFSEEYVRSLMDGGFEIDKMESGEEMFYGNDSAYVKVIARKI